MWSTIPTPWRAPISPARSISATGANRAPFERDRHAALELDLDDLRLVRRLLGTGDELEHVVLGRVVELLDPAALARAPPQVVVDRVRGDLGAALDRDPVLARVRDLLVAAHPPGADGRDHLQLGASVAIVASIRTWSLPLPVQPWAIVSQPGLARVLDRELGDQRPAERREQRIAEPVDRVGLDRREHVLARELLARVDHVRVDRAELERLAPDDLVVLAGLPEVDGQRHDLGLVLVLDPLEHHARVEAAAVEQQHAVHLGRVGLVASWSADVRKSDALTRTSP